MQCATASMAIAPVGLINAGNPAQAYLDAYILAGINQDGAERDAAASLSAGIAAACLPDATPQTITDALLQQSTYLMRRAVELAFDIAARCSSVESFTEAYYRELADWSMPRPLHKVKEVISPYPQRARYYSGSSYEIIPVALALLNYCDWDVNRSIIAGTNFGRDCDTVATIAGCLAGTLHGAAAINPSWMATCEEANTDLFESLDGYNLQRMAEALLTAFQQEEAVAQERLYTVQRLLNGMD
jgi:hypothetical protein